MRYFIELAFRGTNYYGWQIQPNAVTVQEVLNDRVSKLLRRPVDTIGCGRTDTGVHASQFFAHFDYPSPLTDIGNIVYKLNRMLPEDIFVYNLFAVNNEAHARFDATQRTYRYYIETQKNPFSKGLVTFLPYKPDIDLMNRAAAHLLNVSDFASFCKTGGNNKTTVCNVVRAEWFKIGETLLCFEISADRFLRNMVRAIVGTLLDVGRKKISVHEFVSIVELKNRSLAGQSVLPDGLYLYNISYPYYQHITKINPPFFENCKR